MRAPDVLNKSVKAMFADARLTPQPVVGDGVLHLWMLDEACIRRAFSADEIRAVEESPAYWAMCWPAGRAMAAHLLATPDLVRGRRVLDLGAGSGVVAIAALKAGASGVLACDNDPVALEAARANAALNGLVLETVSCVPCNARFDIALLADVLYDPAHRGLVDLALECASEVWVADSRVSDWHHPAFCFQAEWPGRMVPAFETGPDFTRVKVWRSELPFRERNAV
jgi:predicted nicotinamide N-methyase